MSKMPISEDVRAHLEYKQKYQNLKRKLKILLYENECYQEELKRTQRQFLQITRDKNFLLERLLQYEQVQSSSSDSDATDSSDSGHETSKPDVQTKRKRQTDAHSGETSQVNSGKRKKPATSTPSRGKNASSTGKSQANKTTSVNITTTNSTSATVASSSQKFIPIHLLGKDDQNITVQQRASTSKDGQLTSEELERHFESRPIPSSMLLPEKALLTVPVELFSNESSTGLPDDDNWSLAL